MLGMHLETKLILVYVYSNFAHNIPFKAAGNLANNFPASFFCLNNKLHTHTHQTPHTHTHLCVRANTHTYTHAHTRTHTQTHTYTQTHTHLHRHTYYTNTHTHTTSTDYVIELHHLHLNGSFDLNSSWPMSARRGPYFS
jgi:hypothetical protein